MLRNPLFILRQWELSHRSRNRLDSKHPVHTPKSSPRPTSTRIIPSSSNLKPSRLQALTSPNLNRKPENLSPILPWQESFHYRLGRNSTLKCSQSYYINENHPIAVTAPSTDVQIELFLKNKRKMTWWFSGEFTCQCLPHLIFFFTWCVLHYYLVDLLAYICAYYCLVIVFYLTADMLSCLDTVYITYLLYRLMIGLL